MSLGGVSTAHVGLDSATLEEGGVHIDPGWVPVGPVELVPAKVDVEENTAAEAFWELLEVAGYTIW